MQLPFELLSIIVFYSSKHNAKSSLITNALAEHCGYLCPDIPAWDYLLLMPLSCLNTEFVKIWEQNHSAVFLSYFLYISYKIPKF